MTRVIINLQKSELKALVNLAEREYRDTRQQAALIIRQELARLGLLVIETHADPAPLAAVPAEDPKQARGEAVSKGGNDATH